jgi:hypothetical protein
MYDFSQKGYALIFSLSLRHGPEFQDFSKILLILGCFPENFGEWLESSVFSSTLRS